MEINFFQAYQEIGKEVLFEDSFTICSNVTST